MFMGGCVFAQKTHPYLGSLATARKSKLCELWHTDDSLSKLICNKFGMAHKKDVLENYMLCRCCWAGENIPALYTYQPSGWGAGTRQDWVGGAVWGMYSRWKCGDVQMIARVPDIVWAPCVSRAAPICTFSHLSVVSTKIAGVNRLFVYFTIVFCRT